MLGVQPGSNMHLFPVAPQLPMFLVALISAACRYLTLCLTLFLADIIGQVADAMTYQTK